MTTSELHEILDDENRKITVNELRSIIDLMRHDVLDEQYKCLKERTTSGELRAQWYCGEENAFYIILQLMDHLEV